MAESISLVGHGSQSPCPLGEFYRAMREKESAEGGGERRGSVIDGFQRRETKKTNFTARKESFLSSN